jgi:hypothetical protein
MRVKRSSSSSSVLTACLALVALCVVACGGDPAETSDVPAQPPCDSAAPPSRTASCIASFSPGEGAGFGQDKLPGVIYGEPRGGGLKTGSMDVLALGAGGEIIVGFGGNSIVNGEGPDFLIFENAFYVGGAPEKPYKELGEVSVSEDGVSFVPFPCASAAYPFEGCAGWRAVLASPESGISAFDPDLAGGDPFDLADVGLTSARFVKIRDLATAGQAPSAGFDLDAVAIINPSAL